MIITLSGINGAGKTTFARTLCDYLNNNIVADSRNNFQVISFAEKIRKIVSILVGEDIEKFDWRQKSYKVIKGYRRTLSIRDLMIEVGNQINKIMPNYFITELNDIIKKDKNYIISDLRTDKEHKYISGLNVPTYKILIYSEEVLDKKDTSHFNDRDISYDHNYQYIISDDEIRNDPQYSCHEIYENIHNTLWHLYKKFKHGL
jgi:hypothetical protein